MPSFGVSTISPKKSSSFNISTTSAIASIKSWNRHQMKNNIRYKGNTNNTSVIIFLIGQKLPAMVLCLGEPPRRFLLLLLYLHFIFVSSFHFWSSFCCCCSSFHFQTVFPCHRHSNPGFSGPWKPPPALSSTLTTFDCLCFSFYWEHYGFEWALFTHRHFLPYAPSPGIFDSTCVYEGLSGSRQFFLEVCRASYWSSKLRSGPPACLNHSNPQSSYSERFSFKFYNIPSWITCGKKFSLYAPYLFRTLSACSKSYVKIIKKHFEQH